MRNYVFCLISLLSCATTAQVCTFEFNGYIYSSGGGWIPEKLNQVVGQKFTGWFQYNSEATPVVENPGTIYTRYHYDQNASIEIALPVLGVSHINKPVNIILDNNRYEPRSRQYYDYFSYSFTTNISDYGNAEYQIYFMDTTGTAFNCFELPCDFNLSDFDIGLCNIYMGTVDKPIHFYGLIENITRIPEPASLFLLTLGGLLILKK